jgi:hypothetical protein
MAQHQPVAEHCENCGRVIGKLEAAHVHTGHVVCAECLPRVRLQSEPCGEVAPPGDLAEVPRVVRCPSCGATLSASARRCGVCGNALGHAKSVDADRPASAKPALSKSPRNKFGAIALVILLAGIAYFRWYQKGVDHHKAEMMRDRGYTGDDSSLAEESDRKRENDRRRAQEERRRSNPWLKNP